MEDYYYFDTDALVKLMLDEKGCIGVRSIYDNDNNVIICSAFSILEVVSALGQNKSAGYIYNGVYKDSLAYFNKIITINEEGKATIRVESNINLEQIECAKNLINKAWENDLSIKPGDSLQLAVALKYIDLDLTLVTGDKKIIDTAKEISEYTDKDSFKNIIDATKCFCSCGGVFELDGKRYRCNKCGLICNICNIDDKWCQKV